MFIVSLTYIANVCEIEKYLNSHLEYLEEHYSNGVFLASGRKVPRTGGIILAKVESRSELDAILNDDPFKVHHLANYEITEFLPSKTAPGLEFLIQ